MNKKLKSDLLLMLTAFIWGSAFVAQKSGMDYIEPLTYNGIRTFIGGIVLIPVILLFAKKNGTPVGVRKSTDAEDKAAQAQDRRVAVIGGICCGLALFVASSLQQFGISYTTAGKAGFITTLYVVIVPILSILLHKKVRPVMWLCVAMGVVGLYLLCMTDNTFRLQFGDMLVLLCAFAFAVHIMVIDHFSPQGDGICISCVQFLTAGALGLIGMFIFENPSWAAIVDCAVPILYAGVMSCGVAYTLQVVAQANADPTAATLILSLESVFAVISGAIILHEIMSPRELLGCVVIFAAVIIAQLPSKEERAAKAEARLSGKE